MGNRKTLQELTFKDNFMFAAVMMDADNCKVVSLYQPDTTCRGPGVPVQ